MITIGIGNYIGHSSKSRNWTPPNFKTTNSASDNVAALNDALTNHSSVYIKTPGVYEINDTIFIPSNRTLEFVAGCTLKKATGSDFCHVIANKGILTRTANTNINIIGNGLIIDINGIDSVTAKPLYGLRGQIGFFQVSDFLIKGIETTTVGLTQFFLHLDKVSNGILRLLDIEGWKDSIHFGDAHDILLEDIRTCSGDDGISLNACDYAISNETLGDIYNITIRRWTDDYYEGQNGSGALLLSGSWANWVTGTTYQCNDIVVNEGRIYQKTNAGTAVASVAPTHTSGSVTGADGIPWLWKQDGTINHLDVKNITIEDSTWSSSRALVRTLGSSDATFRAFFPTTGSQAIVDDIIIDNVTDNHVGDNALIVLDVNVGTLEIKNSTHSIVHGSNLVYIIERPEAVAIEKITYNNCDITLNTDEQVVVLPGVVTYPYTIAEIEVLNSVVNTPDSQRAYLFSSPSDAVDLITLTDSIFKHLKSVATIVNTSNVSMNIIANGCVFEDSPERLIDMYNATNSVVNFTADGCTFEETSLAMFKNNQAGSQLNIITTNSLGESIPQLTDGTVDVTESDLTPIPLGANILINGKFRENVTGWSCENGVLTWDVSKCMAYTINGTVGNNDIIASLSNPLSDNIRLTFRAKSPTLNTTFRSNYNPNTLTPVSNPALSTDWQNYQFEGSRGASSGGIYILTTDGSLANESIIYFDDIQVVQY